MRSLVTFLLAVTFAAMGSSQDPGAPPPTDEQRAVFALIDKFAPPFDATRPFIAVRERGPGARECWFGWLLRANERRFEIHGIDLGRRVFDARTHLFEAVDPRDALSAACRRLAPPDADGTIEWFRYFGLPASRIDCPEMLLLLARAAFLDGRFAAVHEAWLLLPEQFRTRPGVRGFQMARVLADRLAANFADATYSWQTLLEQHDVFLAEFHVGHYVKRVRAQHTAIAAHLSEAAARTPGSADDPAELVFALRDEFHLAPRFRPLSDQTFHPPDRPTGPTPGQRLIAMGLRAVPALLAARDDQSLSRCVRINRFGQVAAPRTVGDLAEIVLVEIAGFRPDNWDEWAKIATTAGIEAAVVAHAERGDADAIGWWYSRHPGDLDRVVHWAAALSPAARLDILLRHAPTPVPRRVVEEAHRVLELVRGTGWETLVRHTMARHDLPLPTDG